MDSQVIDKVDLDIIDDGIEHEEFLKSMTGKKFKLKTSNASFDVDDV